MKKESLLIAAAVLVAVLFLRGGSITGSRLPATAYYSGKPGYPMTPQQIAAYNAAQGGNSVGGILSAATNAFSTLYKTFSQAPAAPAQPLVVVPDASTTISAPSLPSLGLTYPAQPPADLLSGYNPATPVFTGNDPSAYVSGALTASPDITAAAPLGTVGV